MIEMHSKYGNMHKNGFLYTLICINNHIITCRNCMLSTHVNAKYCLGVKFSYRWSGWFLTNRSASFIHFRRLLESSIDISIFLWIHILIFLQTLVLIVKYLGSLFIQELLARIFLIWSVFLVNLCMHLTRYIGIPSFAFFLSK